MISAVPQSDLVIHAHSSIPFQMLFPCRWSQSTGWCFLCFTAGPHWPVAPCTSELAGTSISYQHIFSKLLKGWWIHPVLTCRLLGWQTRTSQFSFRHLWGGGGGGWPCALYLRSSYSHALPPATIVATVCALFGKPPQLPLWVALLLLVLESLVKYLFGQLDFFSPAV